MKPILLALMLILAVTACAGGRDVTVNCPDDQDKQLTREEWQACNGRQDKDGRGGP